MKWWHGVLVAVSLFLMLGLLGVQIWFTEHELARQKVQVQQQIDNQKAANELWQAQMKAQAGQPGVPFPLPPPSPPPVVSQPPIFFPWFAVWPALMAPLYWVIAVEQNRLQKLQHQEEEERTRYTEEDLMQDWEFKIVRCHRNFFDQPAFLERALQEEARAGWQLVEKFDGTRIRLKRLSSQRAGDANLPRDYDPYRTSIRPKITLQHIVRGICWTLFVMCTLSLPMFAFVQSKDPISPEAFRALMWALGAGVVLFGAIALFLTLRAKKAEKQV